MNLKIKQYEFVQHPNWNESCHALVTGVTSTGMTLEVYEEGQKILVTFPIGEARKFYPYLECYVRANKLGWKVIDGGKQ